jgi:hypothetical protein
MLISCRSTQLVVIQARLLHQVLLGKAQYLQARSDYRHSRGTEDAGNVHQSTLGGRLLLRLCGRCLLCSNGSRCSALLRFCGHHLFDGGGCGFCALLMSRGLVLQLRYEFFNSGGWATTPSQLPHCVSLAFVALLDGLRRRHPLHTRKISYQQAYSLTGTRPH